MPELPEVETVVRGLRTRLLGKTIVRTELVGAPTFRRKIPSFLSEINNVVVENVTRHGKSIFFHLQSNSAPKQILHIHLGMTGQLLWKENSSLRELHTHVVFHLNDNTHQLRYRDIRRFGQLHLNPSFEKFLAVPDAWEASEKMIFDALFKKNSYMKQALLNQKFIVGLGNIYVDESLFLAKIHPKKKLQTLNERKLTDLCGFIKKVLGDSIKLGGTSFSNYVDMYGGRGGFKGRLSVYGKQGTPCPICKTKIKKIVFAGRGTHFCPSCQKAPQ